MLVAVPRYTRGEEIANSVIHGVGILLAIGGLGVLTAFASIYGDAWHIVSCSVFGFTLIFQYATSTLYHSIQLPSVKPILRILDHVAIFILIAGTYTPFTLVNMRGPWGWSIFGIIWGLALVGIILEITPWRRYRSISISLYLLMGWAALTAIKPMISTVPAGGLTLLFTGGLAYTSGVIFYLWRSLPYNHAIWHLFVLVGSSLHFFAVLFYVIPLA
ncbi:MAG: hemolysin III family protein [Exilibacterium sp.]